MHYFFLLLITGEVGQTGDNLNGPHLKCVECIPTPLKGVNSVDGHYHAMVQHPTPPFLNILFRQRHPLVPQHLTIINTVNCSAPLLTIPHSWYMWSQKKCKNHLCYWWLHFDWQCQMFLFQTLSIYFGSPVMPHLHSVSKPITFSNLRNTCICALLWLVLKSIL
jgi:hypothetical protein